MVVPYIQLQRMYILLLCTCTLFQHVQSFELGSLRLHPRPRLGLQRLLVTENQEFSDSDQAFIKKSLLRNAQFSKLSETKIASLVDNFEKIDYNDKEVIVQQGDSCDGDYVYMVGSNSECSVLVDGELVPEPYGTLKERAVFGDLAVLYNETRAATIRAKAANSDIDQVSLYRINGDTYKTILYRKNIRAARQQELNQTALAASLSNMQQIDDAINEISGATTLYKGNIIPPYKPERTWLWKKWSKTILAVSYKATLLNMLVCWLFLTFAGQHLGNGECLSWRKGLLIPDSSHPFVQRLSLIHKIWTYQQGLTTFILTFFLSEAYGFWKNVYDLARGVQGRLNDINILASTCIKRNEEDGTPTTEARHFLDDIGRYSRLHHVLLWVGTARRFAVLNTPEGLERMASRDLMTKQELEVLLDSKGFSRLSDAPLQWMMIRANRAMREGILDNDDATKSALLDQTCRLRAQFGSIGDKLDGRIPLAYTHFVQILVDLYVVMAPFALYSQLGNYSIFAVGILTLFYTGLLNLAKIFLDPLNNENFCRNSIFMDLGVLIRETNGGSIRWRNAAEKLPFFGLKA